MVLKCSNCRLDSGPVCTTLPGGLDYSYGHYGEGCDRKKYGSTFVGNFMYCEKDTHKFGPGTIYGILGWYPGRGY